MEKTVRRLPAFLLMVAICLSMILFPVKGTGNVRAEESEEAFWRSLSSRYYYKQLSSEEKKLYDRFDAACMGILLDDETDIT